MRQVSMCPYTHVPVPMACELVQYSRTIVIYTCHCHQCASARFGLIKWPFNFLLASKSSSTCCSAASGCAVPCWAGAFAGEACSKLKCKCFSVNIKEKMPLQVRSLTFGFLVEPVIWGLTRLLKKVRQDALHVSVLFRGLAAPRLSYTGPTEG